jgi:hypothetical protein
LSPTSSEEALSLLDIVREGVEEFDNIERWELSVLAKASRFLLTKLRSQDAPRASRLCERDPWEILKTHERENFAQAFCSLESDVCDLTRMSRLAQLQLHEAIGEPDCEDGEITLASNKRGLSTKDLGGNSCQLSRPIKRDLICARNAAPNSNEKTIRAKIQRNSIFRNLFLPSPRGSQHWREIASYWRERSKQNLPLLLWPQSFVGRRHVRNAVRLGVLPAGCLLVGPRCCRAHLYPVARGVTFVSPRNGLLSDTVKQSAVRHAPGQIRHNGVVAASRSAGSLWTEMA